MRTQLAPDHHRLIIKAVIYIIKIINQQNCMNIIETCPHMWNDTSLLPSFVTKP